MLQLMLVLWLLLMVVQIVGICLICDWLFLTCLATCGGSMVMASLRKVVLISLHHVLLLCFPN